MERINEDKKHSLEFAGLCFGANLPRTEQNDPGPGIGLGYGGRLTKCQHNHKKQSAGWTNRRRREIFPNGK